MHNSNFRLFFIFIFFFIFLFTCNSSYSFDDNEASRILKKIEEKRKGLDTFKSDLKIKAIFSGICIPFDGKLFYKKPDRLKLDISGIPEIIKSKKGIFKKAIPKSFKPEDYIAALKGEEALNGKDKAYKLYLIPKKDPEISCVYLWVDETNLNVVKSIVIYSDTSKIASSQSFLKFKDYYLPDKQSIIFTFPAFSCKTEISYSNYAININLDEKFK
jgi:hypothetical protein